MAVVIDASALIFAVSSQAPAASTLRRRLATEATHAPHLIDAELGSVLRRHVLAGRLSPAAARKLLDEAANLVSMRYATSARLRGAAWELRDNLTFYDALYVALAQALELRLVTADARLARAPRLPCAAELIDLDAPG